MDSSPPQVAAQATLRAQDHVVVQIDPKCLHSALKEFFEPLRTNDPRADFFSIYRKESDEFDRDYVKKYDEDLNTSLIFAGLFSAVSSAFIIDVQSKLEPDPNDMTAAYMQLLIHTMNNSLFPNADPDSITWTGPPPGVVSVQTLLYASLATSLFTAFIAMLGKQWINRYLRNRGGSAVDKSRNRQRKLDGLEKWHFQLVIESLPVMLQLALLLLGFALSRYLWTISRTIAGVILAATLFGVTAYVFLTLAATFYYNCPYQTPPSILARTIIKCLARTDIAFIRRLRSLTTPIPSIKVLKGVLQRLRSGVRSVLKSFRCTSALVEGTGSMPVAIVVASPTRIFEDVSINWELCKADARCISWVLHSTTDTDVIFSTVRFAADTILYPELVEALSPCILVDLFFDCMLDGQVVPGKSEHASSIGMALASVLSTRLSIEPRDGELMETCECIQKEVELPPRSHPMFRLVVMALKFVTQTPSPTMNGMFLEWWVFETVPDRLSTTCKLWLSRVILQTIWRWRCVQDPTTVLHFFPMIQICKGLMADGSQTFVILKTNCFLILAIALGLQIDSRDLYPPNNNDALQTVTNLFYQWLETSIREGNPNRHGPAWALSALNHLVPVQAVETGELGFSWVAKILNSDYSEDCHYRMASSVVQLLGKHFYYNAFYSGELEYSLGVEPGSVPLLSGFLSLSEKFYATDFPPYPAFTALRILSNSPGYGDFGPAILPVLALTLLPTHPLQSRILALKVFVRFSPGWFSPNMEAIPRNDLSRLLRAVGDPFQFTPDLPPQDDAPVDTVNYEPMMAAIILIEFALSDLWQKHLHHSNFTSCEEILSTEEGKRNALRCMLDAATDSWPGFLLTPANIIAAIRRLEELQGLNTAEVVIMWAWTVGVVDAVDHDGWKSFGDETLRFYQAHGIGRLSALKQRITDATMEAEHLALLMVHYRGSPCRVDSTRRPVSSLAAYEGPAPWYSTDLRISLACQLRRLYHLFGYEPTMWREGVAAEDSVGGGVGRSLGRSEMSVRRMDWACDYP